MAPSTTPAAASGDARSTPTPASRFVASTAGLVLTAMLWWSATEYSGLFWQRWWADAGGPGRTAPFVLLGLALAAAPWLERTARRGMVLAVSILVGAKLLGWFIVVPVLFTMLVVRVSRTAWPVWLKLAVVAVAWAAVPAVRTALRRHWGAPTVPLAFYWGTIPFAAVYLVVDRARGQLPTTRLLDALLYMVAAPRFISPYVQPISAATFVSAERDHVPPSTALKALALGGWGMALQFIHRTHHVNVRPRPDHLTLAQHVPDIVQNLGTIYAVNAGNILCAVAMLRLLGFDLGAGFRWPGLSRSGSEFYRRWNYYFFQNATSLFHTPLIGRLRRWLPLRVSYALAGLPAFFLGVWLPATILPTLAENMNPNPISGLMRLINPGEPVTYAFAWLALTTTQFVAAPFRRLRRRLWWQIGGLLLVWLVLASTLTLTYARGWVVM